MSKDHTLARTRFVLELDIEDCEALLLRPTLAWVGSAEGYHHFRNQIEDVMANLKVRGNCPECGGNGQLHGDYGMDWNCRTCQDKDIPSFIDRHTLEKEREA